MITTEGFFVIWCQHPHEADVSHSVCFFVVVLNQGDGALGFVLFFVRYTKPSGAFVKKKARIALTWQLGSTFLETWSLVVRCSRR